MVKDREVILGMIDIRSVFNAGAMVRTAEGMGISKVVAVGTTPWPGKGLPHEQEKLKREIHKVALGAEEMIQWTHFETAKEAIVAMREQGFKIYALEQCEQAEKLPVNDIDDNVFLIVGEERFGFSKEVLNLADRILEIPMKGQKESFNVAVAAGIGMWALSPPPNL